MSFNTIFKDNNPKYQLLERICLVFEKMLSRKFVVKISFFVCYSFFLEPREIKVCMHWGNFAPWISCQKVGSGDSGEDLRGCRDIVLK